MRQTSEIEAKTIHSVLNRFQIIYRKNVNTAEKAFGCVKK